MANSLGGLGLWTVVFISLVSLTATPALAADGLTLRWMPQGANVEGYRAYVGNVNTPSHLAPVIELGQIEPDSTGVSEVEIPAVQVLSILGGMPNGGQVSVAMTAYNDIGESEHSNRVTLELSGGDFVDAFFGSTPRLYAEDFDSGKEPSGWVATEAESSTEQGSDLFETTQVAGEVVYGTTSEEADIHSHFAGADSAEWSNYEFRGRLHASDVRSGIGVTVLSDYPNSDSYYRLAYLGSGDFHIANHLSEQASGDCVGSTQSGVGSSPDHWYQFRFQALGVSDGTQLRAKVWSEIDSEPAEWQIECKHLGYEAFDAGRPGLWSDGPGQKYWDDLEVIPLQLAADEAPPVPLPSSEPVPAPTDDGMIDFELTDAGADPEGWLDTQPGHSLSEGDSLFKVLEVGAEDERNRVLGTFNRAADVHSHLIDLADDFLYDYEFKGRMRISISNAGVGATVYSSFPSSDSYYRLRAHRGENFHLSSRPDGTAASCLGVTDSGVPLETITWYSFRFQAFDDGAGTRLRVKIWPEDRFEPVSWQIDCVDESAERLQAGVPGVWSTGSGQKYWDDLELVPLEFE